MHQTDRKPKVVVIVQVRMGSVRLPGKHLKIVRGKALISYLIERLKRVKLADALVLATTTNPRDDILEAYCKEHEISCFRGSEEDVLDRFAQVSKAYNADVIVRICGDCPLIDPQVIDQAISCYLGQPAEAFVSNVLERTYPRGMDVEVFSAKALFSASKEAHYPEEREHVTPFLHRHPERFPPLSIKLSQDESSYRWTVDTEADLQLITKFIEALYPTTPFFSLKDLLLCAKQHPEWDAINAMVLQKNIDDVASEEYTLAFVRPIEAHARLIFDWRNDPGTRKASFHMGEKEWRTFYAQFSCDYFGFPDLPPLFVIHKGEPQAFLRLEPVDNPLEHTRRTCKVSINVSPRCRGKGVGHQALLLAKEFLRTQGYDDVYAEVKTDNAASIKTFIHAGFQAITDDKVTVFDTGDVFSIHRFVAPLSTTHSYACNRVYVIAEAGSNWCVGGGGRDFSVAKKLIAAAAEAGADAVKFQIFQPETIYVPNAGQSNYLSQAGIQEEIVDLFRSLAMPPEMIPQLAAWAKEVDLDFMATPFSPKDFTLIDPYVKKHKIASYEIGHVRLLELAAKSGKPLILSTGAAKDAEIQWAVETFRRLGGTELTLMQCTACYPASPGSMNLRAILWLMKRFKVSGGLSDHSLDPFAAPLAAIAMGATVIEKHFTLDKTFEGPDHAFALEPAELRQMIEAIRTLEPMLGSEMKYVHESELELRSFARRGVQATSEIHFGDQLRENQNIAILRPGNQPLGVHPLFLPRIEGQFAKRNISLGEGIQHGDF